MARPTKYDKKYCDKVKKLAEKGCTDKEIADFLDISESTLNLWKLKHSEFSESLKQGKAIPDQKVERSLYQLCNGYKHKAVKIFCDTKTGAIYTKEYIERFPPNVTACIYWTKNRMPERWRDIRQTELTGKDGGPVKVQQLTDQQLDEEIAKLEQQLANNKPGKGQKAK